MQARTATLVLAAALLVPATARAGHDTWRTDQDGRFNSGPNWSDGTVPTEDDTVEFGVDWLPYVVWWDLVTGNRTTRSMSVTDNDVTFRVSDSAGSPYTWSITDAASGADASITGGTMTLGLAGYVGSLILDIDDALTVDGGGTLNVTMGNQAQCATTTVGSTGSGTLAIESGGNVSDTDGYIGRYGTSDASVTVDGGTWTNHLYLYVGYFGEGTLTVTNGGSVSSAIGEIANFSGSSGTVIVEGGTWASANQLRVGISGTGTLTVTGGGTVSNTNCYVGYSSNSIGTVTVDGGTWTNGGWLNVGEHGEGSLTVTGGGSASGTDAYVARQGDSAGTVTVTGEDSVWLSTGNLCLGGTADEDGGDASLTVSGGGRVYVGDVAPATIPLPTHLSAVIVSDTHESGSNLVVRNAATLDNSGYAYLGYNTAETGTATVTGLGSMWTNDFDVYVGFRGQGTLEVTDGSGVAGNYCYVGMHTGSTGTVTVNGGTWTVDDILRVGVSGEGTLTVAGGGSVSGFVGLIGDQSGSTGTVTVDGGTWANSALLSVGHYGEGTLEVTGGGQVSSTNAAIAYGDAGPGAAATGKATVSGTDSTWTDSDSLYVGGGLDLPGGTGELAVSDGGTVGVAQTLKVWGGGTVNLQAGGTIAADTFDHSHGGTLNFTGGTLAVTTFTGDLLCAGGTVAPGASPGTTTVDGNLTMHSGTVRMELGGTGPGEYDAVHVADTATLGGTLAVELIDPYRPGHNHAFQVMTFASRDGTTFDEHQGLDLGGRLTLVPNYRATDLVLTAVQGGPGEWAVDAGGDASVPANWSAGLPNGVGDLATFGSAITAPREVTVDVPTTLGGMMFDSAEAYTLAGPNPLTFETEAGAAAINVADLAATHVIAAHVVLADALDIDVAELGTLVFEGLLDNGAGQTVTKTGAGTLVIDGPQDHAAATGFEILGGTVDMNSAAGAAGTPNLSILVDDAVLNLGCNQYLDTLTLRNGALVRFTGANVVVLNHLVMDGVDLGAMTLTPEPATLLLIGAGLALAIARKQNGRRG